MAIVRGKLAEIQTIPSTVGSIYANPASTKTFISGFTVHNTNTTSETVEIHCVPDSTGSLGTAALTNRIWKETLAADETAVFSAPPDGIPLEDENDSIQAKTTTASKVTIILHGVKEA